MVRARSFDPGGACDVTRLGRASAPPRYPPQPQAPPQQPPPPLPEDGDGAELARPPTATADSSLTVSSWPFGQVAGAADSLMGRVCSKVSPQARQRYSYRGTIMSVSQRTSVDDG